MISLAEVAQEVHLRVDQNDPNIPKLKKSGVYEILKASFDVMSQALASGEDIGIPQFGKFVVKKQEARTARNPKTGESIKVPAKMATRFRPSSVLRQNVAGTKVKATEKTPDKKKKAKKKKK